MRAHWDLHPSVMINRYRRKARQVAQLNLGPFLPLHEIIPELAALGAPPIASVPSEPTQLETRAGDGGKVIVVNFRRG